MNDNNLTPSKSHPPPPSSTFTHTHIVLTHIHRKIEEESSDGGFDDMKLSDLINSEPSSLSHSNNVVVDTSFAERIVECLRDLGGKGK